jgi:hypothetical protein
MSVLIFFLITLATILGMLFAAGGLTQQLAMAAQIGLLVSVALLILLASADLTRSLVQRWKRFLSRLY